MLWNRRVLETMVAIGLLAGTTVRVPGTAVGADDSPVTARLAPAGERDAAGWKLVFSDDFDRGELGPNWKVVDGTWTIKDGCLRGSGTLISTRGLGGNRPPAGQRLEFEAATDLQPIIFFKDQPKPKVMVGDLSSFIQAEPLEKSKKTFQTGYFGQFGGMGNTVNRLMRLGSVVRSDDAPDRTVVPDQRYRIVLENDGGKVRCVVDGTTLVEWEDADPVVGTDHDRVGFYFFVMTKVFGVKVFAKPSDGG